MKLSLKTLTITTIVVLYVLILIGGIVRSTGSGMGCPDWPKCFGQWVPPTEVSELPNNYQALYGAKLKGEVVFNAIKTWIEYLNRLFGVLTGLFILANFVASLTYRKSKPRLTLLSGLAVVLVAFQGWLGSKVVSSELANYMVTLHMLLAFVIVFVLLYVLSDIWQIETEKITNLKRVNQLLVVTLSLSVLQILFGTQVREAIDDIARTMGEENRNNWVNSLGITFYVHRSFSAVVLGLHLGLIYLLKKNVSSQKSISKLTNALVAMVVFEILTGMTLAYLGMPPWAQPVHLTLASVMVGVQFLIFTLSNKNAYSTSRS